MRPFAYVKPVDVEAAVLAAAEPGAKFLGGGTNLVDLMREGIERPDTVVDVTGLPFDTVDELPGGVGDRAQAHVADPGGVGEVARGGEDRLAPLLFVLWPPGPEECRLRHVALKCTGVT